jgi:hypothetical protein
MIPVTIVDNFFETPSLIRNYGLSLEYGKPPGGVCPGIRTRPLHLIDNDFHLYLGKKISSLFFNLDTDRFMIDLESYFQLSNEKYEEGWVHKDNDSWSIAGVIYLHPSPPDNSGTSIYQEKNQNFILNHDTKYQFYNDQPVDIEKMRLERNQNNSNFKKTLDIENVFNRLLVYNAQEYHKENMFFGKVKEDCRMTLLFFAKFTMADKTKLPIDKIRTSIY